MVKNNWIEFVKEYKKKHPGMKYGDVLRKAAKSAEWVKYKEKHGNNKTSKKSLNKPTKKKANKPKKEDKKCECDENKYVSELIEDDEEMLQMIRKLTRENKKLKKELKKNEK